MTSKNEHACLEKWFDKETLSDVCNDVAREKTTSYRVFKGLVATLEHVCSITYDVVLINPKQGIMTTSLYTLLNGTDQIT